MQPTPRTPRPATANNNPQEIIIPNMKNGYSQQPPHKVRLLELRCFYKEAHRRKQKGDSKAKQALSKQRTRFPCRFTSFILQICLLVGRTTSQAGSCSSSIARPGWPIFLGRQYFPHRPEDKIATFPDVSRGELWTKHVARETQVLTRGPMTAARIHPHLHFARHLCDADFFHSHIAKNVYQQRHSVFGTEPQRAPTATQAKARMAQ